MAALVVVSERKQVAGTGKIVLHLFDLAILFDDLPERAMLLHRPGVNLHVRHDLRT